MAEKSVKPHVPLKRNKEKKKTQLIFCPVSQYQLNFTLPHPGITIMGIELGLANHGSIYNDWSKGQSHELSWANQSASTESPTLDAGESVCL